MYKICSRCKCKKILDDFGIDNNRKGGLNCYCKECVRNQSRERKNDKKIYDKLRYKKNKKEIIKRTKKYYYNNKKSIMEKARIRRNIRLKTDINYKLKNIYRCRLYKCVKNIGYQKDKPSLEYLGCKVEDLKKYLESLFTEGMTWENYGKWHIDHIIPCSFFDFSNEEDILRCFHYTNLQPLWAKDNIKKSDNLI